MTKIRVKKFRHTPRAIINYHFPFKLMKQPHGGHILTFNLKKSLEISMHLGGKDINFGFGGGGKILILCKIYTPGVFNLLNQLRKKQMTSIFTQFFDYFLINLAIKRTY